MFGDHRHLNQGMGLGVFSPIFNVLTSEFVLRLEENCVGAGGNNFPVSESRGYFPMCGLET